MSVLPHPPLFDLMMMFPAWGVPASYAIYYGLRWSGRSVELRLQYLIMAFPGITTITTIAGVIIFNSLENRYEPQGPASALVGLLSISAFYLLVMPTNLMSVIFTFRSAFQSPKKHMLVNSPFDGDRRTSMIKLYLFNREVQIRGGDGRMYTVDDGEADSTWSPLYFIGGGIAHFAEDLASDATDGLYDALGVGCGCFVAGTLVETDHGLRPIEKIKIGDLV